MEANGFLAGQNNESLKAFAIHFGVHLGTVTFGRMGIVGECVMEVWCQGDGENGKLQMADGRWQRDLY